MLFFRKASCQDAIVISDRTHDIVATLPTTITKPVARLIQTVEPLPSEAPFIGAALVEYDRGRYC